MRPRSRCCWLRRCCRWLVLLLRPPPPDEAVCEADGGLIARAEGYYHKRKAAKPLNDWARWLISVGVDVGAGVAPFSEAEMNGRVAMWAGWKPFAAELADYRECVAAQQADQDPHGDDQQAEPQGAQQGDTQSDPQQSDSQDVPPDPVPDHQEADADAAVVRAGPNLAEALAPVFPTWANDKGCSFGAVAGNIANTSWADYGAPIPAGTAKLPNYGGFLSESGGGTGPDLSGHDSTSPGFCLLAGLQARMVYDAWCDNDERCTGHYDNRYRRAIMYLIGLEWADYLEALTITEAESYATDTKVRLTDYTEADWWIPVIGAMNTMAQARQYKITLAVTETEYKGPWRSWRSYGTGSHDEVVLDGSYYWQTHWQTPVSGRPIYIGTGWIKRQRKPAWWQPQPKWDATEFTYSHDGSAAILLHVYLRSDGNSPTLYLNTGGTKAPLPQRHTLTWNDSDCAAKENTWAQLRQKNDGTITPGDSPWVQVCSDFD